MLITDLNTTGSTEQLATQPSTRAHLSQHCVSAHACSSQTGSDHIVPKTKKPPSHKLFLPSNLIYSKYSNRLFVLYALIRRLAGTLLCLVQWFVSVRASAHKPPPWVSIFCREREHVPVLVDQFPSRPLRVMHHCKTLIKLPTCPQYCHCSTITLVHTDD